MSRMTEEQIINALECCGKEYGCCNECPYDSDICVTPEGQSIIMGDALDLINRKNAEIKREHETVEDYEQAAKVIHLHLLDFCDENLSMDKMIAEASRRALAEIEKLQHSKSRLRKKIAKDIEKAKSEAIKDALDRAKKRIGDSHFQNYGLAIMEIMDVVKEMEGGAE